MSTPDTKDQPSQKGKTEEVPDEKTKVPTQENPDEKEQDEEPEEPIDLELQAQMKNAKIDNSIFTDEKKEKDDKKQEDQKKSSTKKTRGEDFLDYAQKNDIKIDLKYEEDKRTEQKQKQFYKKNKGSWNNKQSQNNYGRKNYKNMRGRYNNYNKGFRNNFNQNYQNDNQNQNSKQDKGQNQMNDNQENNTPISKTPEESSTTAQNQTQNGYVQKNNKKDFRKNNYYASNGYNNNYGNYGNNNYNNNYYSMKKLMPLNNKFDNPWCKLPTQIDYQTDLSLFTQTKPLPTLTTDQEIISQLELFFSNENLNKDVYLRKAIKDDTCLIDVDILVNHNIIKKNSIPASKILELVPECKNLEVKDIDNKKFIFIKNYKEMKLESIQLINYKKRVIKNQQQLRYQQVMMEIPYIAYGYQPVMGAYPGNYPYPPHQYVFPPYGSIYGLPKESNAVASSGDDGHAKK